MESATYRNMAITAATVSTDQLGFWMLKIQHILMLCHYHIANILPLQTVHVHATLHVAPVVRDWLISKPRSVAELFDISWVLLTCDETPIFRYDAYKRCSCLTLTLYLAYRGFWVKRSIHMVMMITTDFHDIHYCAEHNKNDVPYK